MAALLTLNVEYRDPYGRQLSILSDFSQVNINIKNSDIQQQLADAAEIHGQSRNVFLRGPTGLHKDFTQVLSMKPNDTLVLYVPALPNARKYLCTMKSTKFCAD
jgi:hypothetical protein